MWNISTLIGILIGVAALYFAIVSNATQPTFEIPNPNDDPTIAAVTQPPPEVDYFDLSEEAQQNIWRFLDLSSFLIVFGGVVSSVMIAFSFRRILRCLFSLTILSYIRFFRERLDLREPYISPRRWHKNLEHIYASSLKMAVKRSRGEHLTDADIENLEHEKLRQWVRKFIAIEVVQEKAMKTIMDAEIAEANRQADEDIELLDFMAQASPAFGMVGTVIGLVLLMSQAQGRNISEIIAAMSLALVTTLYGVLMANLVFYPLSSKRAQLQEAHQRIFLMVRDSILLLRRKELPSVARDELVNHLPEGARSQFLQNPDLLK